MTDRPKPKPLNSKNRNDSRPNGKAKKKRPGSGSKRTPITAQMKVIFGKGAYLTFGGVGSDPSTQTNGRAA